MTKAALILSRMTLGKLSLLNAKTAWDNTGNAVDALKAVKKLMPAEDYATYERLAEEEIKWCQENKVQIITIDDEKYPYRLRECPDAPMALFVRGKADLNSARYLAVVGTRKITPYGSDCINKIIDEMGRLCPDVVINSGLAYGVDITAHRAAMRNGMPTIGVVAHGQGTLYPSHHRSDANKMVLGNGAVVTEFYHDIFPEARNFLQRNRIIAGMSDAVLIPESASHGGGLVTVRTAIDYNRDVLAIPGSISSEFSAGPNNLIRDNKASLVTSAEDIINVMGWENVEALEKARQRGIEKSLFVELSADEQKVVDALKTHGDQSVNALTAVTGLPVRTVTSTLFMLEMKGITKTLQGNVHHLVG